MGPAAKVGLGLLGVGLAVMFFSEDPSAVPAPGPSPTPGPTPGTTPGTTPPKPSPTYVPDPTPGPTPEPEPEPVLVGPWCSSVPSAGDPPALDAATIDFVRENTELRIPYLWLMLALYATRANDFLPSKERIVNSIDRVGEYDVQTQKGMQDLLGVGGYVPGVDKGRDFFEAFKAFIARNKTKDRPCPITLPADLAKLVSQFVCMMSQETGSQAAYPCETYSGW